MKTLFDILGLSKEEIKEKQALTDEYLLRAGIDPSNVPICNLRPNKEGHLLAEQQNFQDLESFIYSNCKCSNPIQISRDEFFSNPFLRGWLSFYDSFKVKHPEASLHEVGEAYCVESGIPTEDGTHKFI